MSFRPLYDFILIDRKEPVRQIGSIFIPDRAQEKTAEGTVLAVGKGISNHIHGGWHPPCVAVGDRVLFKTYAENEVGKDLLIREDEIAGVVKPNGTVFPIHDRVFVERDPEVGMSGLVIIPDSAREKTIEGTVVAVGSGKILENGTTVELELKIGERVLFGNKYAGTEIEFDGKKVLVLRQDDVAGVISE